MTPTLDQQTLVRPVTVLGLAGSWVAGSLAGQATASSWCLPDLGCEGSPGTKPGFKEEENSCRQILGFNAP